MFIQVRELVFGGLFSDFGGCHTSEHPRTTALTFYHKIKYHKKTITKSSRKCLKLKNHAISNATVELLDSFETRPLIHKVKGHSNLPLNDMADTFANTARSLPYTTRVMSKFNPKPAYFYTFSYHNNEIIELYPADIVKNAQTLSVTRDTQHMFNQLVLLQPSLHHLDWQ